MSGRQDCVQLWRDVEDQLVSMLQMRTGEHALYMYLLRHSRLEGRQRVYVALSGLARGVCVSECTAREHLRGLARKGCVKLHERGQKGHLVEVFLPMKILGRRLVSVQGLPPEKRGGPARKNREVRLELKRREGGRCFYCRRELQEGEIVMDHVVPLARGGSPGVENLVAACGDCNSRKGEREAEEHLRVLFRGRRLSAAEFEERLEALGRLAGVRADQVQLSRVYLTCLRNSARSMLASRRAPRRV